MVGNDTAQRKGIELAEGVKLFHGLGKTPEEISRTLHVDVDSVLAILNDRPRQLTLAWEVLP